MTSGSSSFSWRLSALTAIEMRKPRVSISVSPRCGHHQSVAHRHSALSRIKVLGTGHLHLSGTFWVAAPPRPTPIPVLVGSYGSERTQPSFPRWRRGPRGLYTDEEQSYISAACVSRVGTYRALKVDEVGTAIRRPNPQGSPTLNMESDRSRAMEAQHQER